MNGCHYWQYILFYRDFEKLLEAFGWPMTIKTASPTLEVHEKFHRTIRNLFRISSSVRLKDKTSPLAESTVFNDDEPLLPIGVCCYSIFYQVYLSCDSLYFFEN